MPAPATDLPAPSVGRETILIVEDEVMVRRVMAMALTEKGYRVLEAVDGEDALRVWNQSRHEISLVVSDMVMPNGLSGLDLAKRLKQEQPDLKMIIVSGYSVDLRKSGVPAELSIRYLAKPFEVASLNAMIRECLDEA